MGVQQYDEIGEAFEGFKSLPLAHYAEVPGFYSREFRRRGAAEVLGIDISGEMVAAARRLEERDRTA